MIEIILLTAKEVRRFGINPVIALLSYSNFGSTKDLESKKLQRVINYFHTNHPNLLVDGEFQANFALNREKMKEQFPYSKLVDKNVNTLIFPKKESFLDEEKYTSILNHFLLLNSNYLLAFQSTRTIGIPTARPTSFQKSATTHRLV